MKYMGMRPHEAYCDTQLVFTTKKPLNNQLRLPEGQSCRALILHVRLNKENKQPINHWKWSALYHTDVDSTDS